MYSVKVTNHSTFIVEPDYNIKNLDGAKSTPADKCFFHMNKVAKHENDL